MTDQPRSERGIHITSDPDRTEITQPETTSAPQAEALPLRLLFVSDLTPGRPAPDWTAGTHVQRVDANNFAAFMQEQSPELEISVPNRLHVDPKRLNVHYVFREMSDFEPEAVARQTPVLERLLRVRDGLRSVKQGTMTFSDLREALGEDDLAASIASLLDALEPSEGTDPSASGRSDGSETREEVLDRLLSLVEEKPSNGTSQELADTLTSAVVGPSRTEARPNTDQIDRVLARLQDLAGEQLSLIFADPSFRALERAWRSLKMLIWHLDFRKGVELEVLVAGMDEVNAAVHYQVVLAEHEREDAHPPLSAVIIDAAFGNTQPDIERLTDLAQSGASLQAPVIAEAAPAFFGVDRAEDLRRLPPLRQLLAEPAFIAYNKLREEDAARFLVLALPSFLLRDVYTRDGSSTTSLVSEEAGLWAHGSVAVALAMAGSFVDSGWPTHLRSRTIDNLPIWKSPVGHTPLAVLIPDSKLPELAKAGFTVLSGKINHDGIFLGRAQTVALPEEHEDLVAATEARVHVTLPCQLFVARAAHFLLTLQKTVEAGPDPATSADHIAQRIRSFLKAGQDGVVVPEATVSVEPVPEAPFDDHELFAVRLMPPRSALDQEVSLVLGLKIRKSSEAAASEEG